MIAVRRQSVVFRDEAAHFPVEGPIPMCMLAVLSELYRVFPCCFVFKGKHMELRGNSGGGRNKGGNRGQEMWGET